MALEIGQQAPNFEALNQFGERVELRQFLGKKVVIYFYPKDATPGCTAQACNLAENFEELTNQNFVILGISADSVESHKKFADKYQLPFSLLADEDKTIVNLYGVWAEKKNYGKTYMGIVRTTFILNEEWIITDIISKVDTKNHAAQVTNLGQ